MIKIALLVVFLTGCASAQHRRLNCDKIQNGVDTIVLASSKTAVEFYKDLKQRAVEKNFYFLQTDEDTKSFKTDFYDITEKSSVQIRVYVKDVLGGSNAIINGRFMNLKKLKKHPYYRSKKIKHSDHGKAHHKAWEAMYKYALGSKKWKHIFLKSE